jgi:hypothetical protein
MPDPRFRIVEDAKAGAALTDLTLLPLLAHFLRTTSSASEAATALDGDLDEVYYRVRKLSRLGLLEVASTEKRAGRPIKRYRAAADAFFVPFALLPHETLARALADSERFSAERRADATAGALLAMTDDPYAWGFRLDRDADGAVSAFWGPREATPDFDVLAYFLAPGRPPVYGTNVDLALSEEEAKRLQAELHELVERWTTRSRARKQGEVPGPTRTILFGVGMAPE